MEAGGIGFGGLWWESNCECMRVCSIALVVKINPTISEGMNIKTTCPQLLFDSLCTYAYDHLL
jgi:hypothetical protein